MSLKIGIVGLGLMGQNHARIVSQNSQVKSLVFYDTDKDRNERVSTLFGAEPVQFVEQLESCHAVIVSTSTDSHYWIAQQLMANKVPMLIEKPLCSTYVQTEQLVQQCLNEQIPLMCGFVERFNPALNTAIGILEEPVRHVFSFRHSPYNSRASSNVVTDLLIHDLDLTARLTDALPEPVIKASGWSPPQAKYIETADCLLEFAGDMTALQSASRWGQRKIRDVRIMTDSLLVEVDLLRGTVTTYRHKSQSGGTGDPASYKSETVIEFPFVRHNGEPLAAQFQHFLGLVDGEFDVRRELESICLPHKWAQEIESQIHTDISA